VIGVRFYLDYGSKKKKRKGQHTGNVIAAHVTTGGRGFSHVGTLRNAWTKKAYYSVECVSALFDEPNSAVCSSSVSEGYLRESCKFISEARAREIHPTLFEYLDECEQEVRFESLEKEKDVSDQS
jgi:hypothetical protein